MDDKRLSNEIEHGKFLASQNAEELWNWSGSAGRLRFARRVRMLTHHLQLNMNVLELGCGTGLLTREIAPKSAFVTAIDISPDLLSIAHTNTRFANVVYRLENAYEMPFNDSSFDSVIGSSVLHHLDISKALKECYRVLRPGGVLCFTEPNMLNPQVFIERTFRFLPLFHYVSTDETAFISWKIKKVLIETGFVHVNVTPFDWIHPSIPHRLIGTMERIGNILEDLPGIRQFSGSLMIKGLRL